MNLVDYTDQRFVLLTVVGRSDTPRVNGATKWKCRCACGKTCDKPAACLADGRSKDCGCVNRIRGLLKSIFRDEYSSWQAMRTRCLNESDEHFEAYGGAGRTLCERWAPRDSFVLFLADMGPKPTPKHTIDRIDNSRGYSPDNCRWATNLEQSSNRDTNVRVTINGETRTIQQWCDHTGIKSYNVSRRMKHLGWSAEKAILTPARRYQTEAVS